MSLRSWMQASLLLLSIGLLVGVHAQSSTTGNITGTVRDPQGAAVPKAEVRDGTPERVAFELTQYMRYWDPDERLRSHARTS